LCVNITEMSVFSVSKTRWIRTWRFVMQITFIWVIIADISELQIHGAIRST